MKPTRKQTTPTIFYSKYKWNRRLPKLMNKEYMILYGIAPNNGRLDMDLNTFTSRYKQKPFEMFNDYKYTTNYINKQE